MWAAGEADGCDPRGALVDERDDEEQMQEAGSYGVLRCSTLDCDGFADGIHAQSPPFCDVAANTSLVRRG